MAGGGLHTHFLEIAFAWLFDATAGRAVSANELQERRALVQRFWEYEAWCLTGSADGPNDDYRSLSQFGHKIVAELARLVAELPVDIGMEIWTPVFALGYRGHYSIRTFLNAWFYQTSEATDADEFGKRWRPMIEDMLARSTNGRGWYYGRQLERQVLGFDASIFLVRMKGHFTLLQSMQNLYKSWADTRLNGDEDDMAGFCAFLSTTVAAPLRIDGLEWIAVAMRSNPDTREWYRETTGSAFMTFLDVLATENTAEISKSEAARRALLELVAYAVSRQLPAALALQERTRRLL